MTAPIKNVVCAAALKDVHSWIHSSRAVVDHIAAERYVLVTPDRHAPIFKAVGEPRFEVVGENAIAPEFDLASVAARMPEGGRSRAGWYYQQLLKIRALLALPSDPDDVLLIWDADTIPLRDLDFVQDDCLIYFRGTEHHLPYFETIRRLLGLERNVDFSFIAQCFPIRRSWLDEFVETLERRSGLRWWEAILDATDLSQLSGFSEYETMGTFLAHTRPGKMLIDGAAWERYGNRVRPIERVRAEIPGTRFAHISYESWDPARPPENAPEIPRPANERAFIDLFFNGMIGPRTVIQVGANDGVMEDPLSVHLRDPRHNDVRAVLIEPLEHYFEKLSRLHADRPNTLMLRAAAGSTESARKFHHIDPSVAEEMNGDGPPNNWAHGQGSFFRESVEYWIKQNQFRGERYRANLDRYLSAIRETIVNVVPLRSIALGGNDNRLLVVDVQGAELDVLLGVDWRRRPNWLILEQDMGEVGTIRDLLTALGYVLISGGANVVWGLADAPVRFVP